LLFMTASAKTGLLIEPHSSCCDLRTCSKHKRTVADGTSRSKQQEAFDPSKPSQFAQ
jgi:hypothetical protein